MVSSCLKVWRLIVEFVLWIIESSTFKSFDAFMKRMKEPAREILVLIASSMRACANAQTRQSFRCSHMQSFDVDEDSNQNLDL